MRALATFDLGVILAATISLSVVVSIAMTAAAEELDPVEPRERVILMRSGRILTGYASRNAGGWLVEQSGGRVQIPLDEVNVVADNLVDAYRQQRDAIVEPTPATHMALAQWCISYRLHNEARDEMRKCLKLDPNHSAARKLLRRLDDILEPASSNVVARDVAPRRSKEGFLVPDAESLGGLSNEVATTYTQRIQPLLINKCGNTSCHGSKAPGESSEGFYLIPVRAGMNTHRLYAERNLAEVMRFVDLSEPNQSQLLTVPMESHGGTAVVFHGAGGSTQFKMLRAWIKTVADEKRAEEEELNARPKLTSKGRRQSSEVSTAADPIDGERSRSLPSAIRDDDTGTTLNAPKRPGKTTGGSSDLPPSHTLAEMKSAQLAAKPGSKSKAPVEEDDRPSDDPFDPDVFNRRFHSSPRR